MWSIIVFGASLGSRPCQPPTIRGFPAPRAMRGVVDDTAATVAAAIAVWASLTAILMFALIKAVMGLRVSEEEELAGLDILEHGAPGYGEGFGVWAPGATPASPVD